MHNITTKEGNDTSGIYPLSHLVGQYTHQGNKYYLNSTTDLLIKVCERKQPTALKPRLYIVSKTVDGKYPFISSLYPQSLDNTYTAEYSRKYFNVVMVDGSINITAK